MKIETLAVDFTDEQKRYLEGFTTGLQISRVGRGLGGGSAGKTNAEPTGPEADLRGTTVCRHRLEHDAGPISHVPRRPHPACFVALPDRP